MKKFSVLLIILIACWTNTTVQAAATLTFINNCAVPLQVMSPTNSSINGLTLNVNVQRTLQKSSLNQNAANTFLVAPVTTNAQCTSIACQNWTTIQASGQRMGAMWQSPNLLYAAYCQPTNAAVQQCNQTTNTPCCGAAMNYDKTFGTTFELTPNGGTLFNQDYVDLSTNYGSGPTSPPLLCGGKNPADNCVTASANIFFNVPVQVAMSQSCAFPPGVTKPGITTLSCNDVSCADAFQHPTDNKLAVCGSETNYTVTYCPGSNQLPTIPLASLPSAALQTLPAPTTPGMKIMITNKLSAAAPCPNGNTVTVFTPGQQQTIQAGGNALTINGDFSTYPGLGLQVNNWYWTAEQLPVQSQPQNPDNAGAQFMLSSECTLSSAAPVFGKGIETFKIADVTAQALPSGDGCLITIAKKPPYTDAVTPACCAPPLPKMKDVCSGPWGVTNNKQPWPPQ